MAKELPFFKFEPNAWDTGNVQMCSRESKGLFVDMCSLYWSRLGEVPYALALQKLCNGIDGALQELKKHQIFGIVDDHIVIDFLDEQLLERNLVSEERRKAAKKRWSDANALQMESKSNARREEENREEERRRELNGAGKPASLTIDDRSKNFMTKIAVHLEEYPKEMLREFYDYWTESNEGGRKMKFEMQKTFDIQKRLAKWASNQKTKPNGTTKNRRETPEELAEAWAKRVKQDFDSGVLSGNQPATS